MEQVTIETDGRWSSQAPAAEAKERDPSEDLLDDDGFEISAVSFVSGRSLETPNRSVRTTGTPVATASRETSSMPRPSTSTKRPAAAVIDLTLSSDEDEPLVRPAKRQQHSAPNGFDDVLHYF